MNDKYKNVNIKVELRDVYQAIEDEPEIEGEMPDELYQFICESKENAMHAYRWIDRETVSNILCRIGKIVKDKR
jgi:hypothetical protein